MQGRLNVRIEQRLVSELVDIAIKERCTTSDLVRQAVLLYLAKKGERK